MVEAEEGAKNRSQGRDAPGRGKGKGSAEREPSERHQFDPILPIYIKQVRGLVLG